MRTTALILGVGLLWVSLPAAAETGVSGQSTARPEARIGSLAPDEARRAERARRRAAEKNAKAAARDTKISEGKSVAVPGKASSGGDFAPAAKAPVMTPVKAAVAPTAVPPKPATASQPVQAAAKGDARVRDAKFRNAEPVRSADREDRVRERHDGRRVARRRTHRDRFAVGSAGDPRFARQGMAVADDPRGALPQGAPAYPMPPRPRAFYIVRAAPPAAFWGYGPRRPFYPGPVYMHDEPVDDVD